MQTSTTRVLPRQIARPSFASTLSKGCERFLAHAIQHALAIGRRSTDDFVRHFPPSLIMKSLRDAPWLRAKILVFATGLNETIALKKSPATAAEDVELAIDEGDVDARSIVMLLNPDERVRHLDARRLWSFLIEGAFWNTSPSMQQQFELATAHLAFLLERAVTDRLITPHEMIESVTLSELVTRLPKSELERIISRALMNGRNGGSFDDDDLITTSTIATLVRYLPMPHLWTRIVEPHIAQAHGLVESADEFEPICLARAL